MYVHADTVNFNLLTCLYICLVHATVFMNKNKYNVLITSEMHDSFNQLLFLSFLSALHVSNESSRSSSAARHNILYYTVWYNRYNRTGESSYVDSPA